MIAVDWGVSSAQVRRAMATLGTMAQYLRNIASGRVGIALDANVPLEVRWAAQQLWQGKPAVLKSEGVTVMVSPPGAFPTADSITGGLGATRGKGKRPVARHGGGKVSRGGGRVHYRSGHGKRGRVAAAPASATTPAPGDSPEVLAQKAALAAQQAALQQPGGVVNPGGAPAGGFPPGMVAPAGGTGPNLPLTYQTKAGACATGYFLQPDRVTCSRAAGVGGGVPAPAGYNYPGGIGYDPTKPVNYPPGYTPPAGGGSPWCPPDRMFIPPNSCMSKNNAFDITRAEGIGPAAPKVCDPGYVYAQDKRDCFKIGGGFWETKAPTPCPAGTAVDASGTCTPIGVGGRTCPVGYQWDDGRKNCFKEGGQFWETTAPSPCPAGTAPDLRGQCMSTGQGQQGPQFCQPGFALNAMNQCVNAYGQFQQQYQQQQCGPGLVMGPYNQCVPAPQQTCQPGFSINPATGMCADPYGQQQPPFQCPPGSQYNPATQTCMGQYNQQTAPMQCPPGYQLNYDGRTCSPLQQQGPYGPPQGGGVPAPQGGGMPSGGGGGGGPMPGYGMEPPGGFAPGVSPAEDEDEADDEGDEEELSGANSPYASVGVY